MYENNATLQMEGNPVFQDVCWPSLVGEQHVNMYCVCLPGPNSHCAPVITVGGPSFPCIASQSTDSHSETRRRLSVLCVCCPVVRVTSLPMKIRAPMGHGVKNKKKRRERGKREKERETEERKSRAEIERERETQRKCRRRSTRRARRTRGLLLAR